MAFSVFINEVVRMASLSRGYFVYAPGETKINGSFCEYRSTDYVIQK